jgi:hypothetical protein
MKSTVTAMKNIHEYFIVASYFMSENSLFYSVTTVVSMDTPHIRRFSYNVFWLTEPSSGI